ncbi:dnaJ homolog subfamily C member 21-like isoform X2 [Arctopsyche grandis]|uniref:dnaJ homolog subfamily C member 21-like isoform X2 n=1 Tax=Arctopsyche grandis TaxID=121162 RepID=UPI00406D7429
MRCYYEVLDVSREAEAAEIKSSYRKLALKWHPDKNLNNLDEAKEQFQVVQNAYEVLSDPQERAWYDSHREQLLRGAGTEFNDDSLDLIPYFTASCFKGFGDDDKGFYAVYTEVFKKLAAEEVDYLDDPEDISKIPTFGKSDTDYETLQSFYTYWLSFSTSKSYVWLDKYDIREADNRKILKLLEKENNKIRQKARKERNEEIRQLVNFVRKRDKRVIAQAKLKEEKALENKKKVEVNRREKLIQRQQEMEEAKKRHKDIGVYTMENFQAQLEEIEKHFVEEFGDSDEENYVTESSEDENAEKSGAKEVQELIDNDFMNSNLQNLYCMACNKLFKNVKSFENHEKSKKHKDNVMNLELETDIGMSGDESSKSKSNKSSKSDDVESGRSDSEVEEEIILKSPKNKKKKNKKQKIITQNSDSDDEETAIADLDLNLRSRKARRSKKADNLSKSTNCSKKVDNVTKISENTSNDTKDEKSTEINPDLPANTVETSSIDVEIKDNNNKLVTNDGGVKENGDKTNNATTKSKKKDKKILNKKASVQINIDLSNLDTSHCCATCKNEFVSKNKLFDHLKKTGHQIYLPDSFTAISNKTQKKKSKQK